MKDIRNNRRAILGAILVLFGILWAIHTIIPWSFNLFFDGWWTLFIIIPCLYGLLNGKNLTINSIGLIVGGLLLLSEQMYISWWTFSHLLLAGIVIILGLRLIFGEKKIPHKAKADAKQILREGHNIHTYDISFGEQHIALDNEVVEGVDIDCSFGALHLDLCKAQIHSDITIKVACSFGGVTLRVPSHCGIETATKSAFGGIADKREAFPSAPEFTIHIVGEISFAGVEIK